MVSEPLLCLIILGVSVPAFVLSPIQRPDSLDLRVEDAGYYIYRPEGTVYHSTAHRLPKKELQVVAFALVWAIADVFIPGIFFWRNLQWECRDGDDRLQATHLFMLVGGRIEDILPRKLARVEADGSVVMEGKGEGWKGERENGERTERKRGPVDWLDTRKLVRTDGRVSDGMGWLGKAGWMEGERVGLKGGVREIL